METSEPEPEVELDKEGNPLPPLAKAGRNYKKKAPEEDRRKIKERTPAQKAAFEKAMAALKEKRESHKATQEREAAANADERHQQVLKARYAKRDANRAKLPPVAQYVTVKDLQDFKKEFFSMMPKEVYKEVPVPVERIVPHAVVKEVVREKIVEKPKVITGNELLDRLYFNK